MSGIQRIMSLWLDLRLVTSVEPLFAGLVIYGSKFKPLKRVVVV